MRFFLPALLSGVLIALIALCVIFFVSVAPPTETNVSSESENGVVPPGPAPLGQLPPSGQPRPAATQAAFTIAYTADTGAFLENCG